MQILQPLLQPVKGIMKGCNKLGQNVAMVSPQFTS